MRKPKSKLAHYAGGVLIVMGLSQGIPGRWTPVLGYAIAVVVGTVWELWLQGVVARQLFAWWTPTPNPREILDWVIAAGIAGTLAGAL